MKEKQRELGTELRLSSRIKSGGKMGSQSLYYFPYSSSLFQKFTILSIQQSIPSQQYYPLFVNNPETCQLRRNLSKITALSAIEDKDDRILNADTFEIEI